MARRTEDVEVAETARVEDEGTVVEAAVHDAAEHGQGAVRVRWSVAWSEFRPGDVSTVELTQFMQAMLDQGRCELLR